MTKIRCVHGTVAMALAITLLGCSSKSPETDSSIQSSMIAPATGRSASTPVGHKEAGVAMSGFVQDIESLTVKNEEFRRVIYTAIHCQLVVMALKPNEEIGAEVHKL